jgi:hypothetical protein
MQGPIWKALKAKRTESRAEEVEHLPSKGKALSSSPSATKKVKGILCVKSDALSTFCTTEQAFSRK